jgi:hypothetical protein
MAENDTDQPRTKKSAKKTQTNPSRDMHSDKEAQVRDDVTLAKDIRLVPDAGEDAGEEQVQELKDREDEVGFRGAAADPTPNENYTVAGVTSGAPTPETHFGQRRAAREARTLNEGVEPI